MANVTLLRQQVADNQRNSALNRRRYIAGHAQYAADTNAFNAEASGSNGYTYYDRATGTNVHAGQGQASAARTFDVAAPAAGTPHNTRVVPTFVETLGKQIGRELPDIANTRIWDAYDKVWRNAPSAGAEPVQRQTKDLNMTLKEVGMLSGKVNPESYADMSKNQTGANSAFADPEDPHNLKNAGVLTRAIAGKI